MATKSRFWAGGIISLVGHIIGAVATLVSLPAEAEYSLQQAIETAQQNDPWLRGSEHRQESVLAQSIVAGQLPDPVVSVNLANLPVDGFDFSQEPMTQFQLGVTQAFPRGHSRSLWQQQLVELSEQQPLMRMDRRAQVAVSVSHTWLDSYRYRESIRLVEENKDLFEDLVDIVQSRYSSALGSTSQYDLIRAQLELTQFEERLIQLQQKQEAIQMLLGEWLPISADNGNRLSASLSNSSANSSANSPVNSSANSSADSLALSSDLPELELLHFGANGAEINNGLVANTAAVANNNSAYLRLLSDQLQRHPAIASIEQRIRAAGSGVELAQQNYKPQWGVKAMYGYRDDDVNGNSRADFFSLGLSMDVPLFTNNRQDKQVQSAVADVEQLKTQKALLLRKMRAQFESERARLRLLDRRQLIYRKQLLREVHAQAEAALTSYTNDEGDFSEVVRARIAELNAHIDALNIDIDRLKTIASLNYFFASSTHQHHGDSL